MSTTPLGDVEEIKNDLVWCAANNNGLSHFDWC